MNAIDKAYAFLLLCLFCSLWLAVDGISVAARAVAWVALP